MEGCRTFVEPPEVDMSAGLRATSFEDAFRARRGLGSAWQVVKRDPIALWLGAAGMLVTAALPALPPARAAAAGAERAPLSPAGALLVVILIACTYLAGLAGQSLIQPAYLRRQARLLGHDHEPEEPGASRFRDMFLYKLLAAAIGLGVVVAAAVPAVLCGRGAAATPLAIACVVPAFAYVWLGLALGEHAVTFEGLGPVAALRRSWELARHSRLRMLRFLLAVHAVGALGTAGAVLKGIGAIVTLPLTRALADVAITDAYLRHVRGEPSQAAGCGPARAHGVAARSLLRDARGAQLVEYILVVGLVALVAVAGLRAFGASARDRALAQARCVQTLECDELHGSGSVAASPVATDHEGDEGDDGGGGCGFNPFCHAGNALDSVGGGLRRGWDAVYAFGSGAVGAVWDIAELGIDLARFQFDLMRGDGDAWRTVGGAVHGLVTDPRGAWDNAFEVGRGVVHSFQEQWRSCFGGEGHASVNGCAHTLGELAPDIVAAVVSGGSATAATRGSRAAALVARHADDAADASRIARAAGSARRLVVGGGHAPGFPHLGPDDVSLNLDSHFDGSSAIPDVRGDAVQAPFRDGSFGEVYFERVEPAAFTGDRIGSIAESARVLEPGGRLIIETGEMTQQQIDEVVRAMQDAGLGEVEVGRISVEDTLAYLERRREGGANVPESVFDAVRAGESSGTRITATRP
jgi:Flp pilus assembly pilin Flp